MIDTYVVDTGVPFDQYEAAVPFERAADCLREIGDAMYGPGELWKGFRTLNNIRFISGEDFYISPANGGPTMYVNFEDQIGPSGGGNNTGVWTMAQMFLEGKCSGRYHWGKAGWPAHLPCFDGAKMYPDTWCDFGCSVEQLDPAGKFAGMSNVWHWNATRGGAPVEFASCCTSQGFNHAQCQCASSSACEPNIAVASGP